MNETATKQRAKQRAPRNRTVTVDQQQIEFYRKRLINLSKPAHLAQIQNRTIHQDLFDAIDFLPQHFADLLFLDPPYNLTKRFNSNSFRKRSTEAYLKWMESWLSKLIPTLKRTASIYICGDWRSCAAIELLIEKYFHIRNRITWEREKGRGAKTNWKNCSEDIWFCTISDEYSFNVDAVKLKKEVVAPYTDDNGKPKDWERTSRGNYRLTFPSNLWTDLTIPFWSMPENTDHHTQKPEKLLAKIILASSREGDLVFDPFLGSGTTSVVAKKLGRRFVGVEKDLRYCCLAEKRLAAAVSDRTIQGYARGVFWERNTFKNQGGNATGGHSPSKNLTLPLFEVGGG